MASLSKGFAFNAGARDPVKPRQVTHKGERRAEKWPSGRVERFVDLQGNVVFRQLVQSGVPPTEDRINSARTRAHHESTVINGDTVQGSIEYGRCPLRHGVRFATDALREEFDKMPANLQTACTEEHRVATRGKGGVIEIHEGCPHIEWLIKSRRERQAVGQLAKRGAQVNHQAEQLNLAKQTLEATNRVNERLVSAVEAMSAKGRKAPNE